MALEGAGVGDGGGLQHPQPSTSECMKDQGTMDALPLQSSEVLRDEPTGRHMAGHALHQESLSHT